MKAAGPTTEKIKIYTSREINVDHRTYRPEEFDQEIDIEAVSIDAYVQSKALKKTDFIKIDIQGFEMQAAKGMERTLANNPHVKIISEFWPYGLSKAGSSATEYFDWLTAKGFTCYLMENSSLAKLEALKVKALEPLGKEHYFNIFALRENV